MLPSAFAPGSSKGGGDLLFAQYKRTLKKKENAQAQREKADFQQSVQASRRQVRTWDMPPVWK